MRFNPRANDPVIIILPDRRLSCRCAAHPNPILAAALVPHAMTSDTSTVYHIINIDGPGGEHALKVMEAEYRDPYLLEVTEVLASLGGLPGLSVATRVCLTRDTAPLTVDRYPDLSFSMLMSWLQGTSWFDAHQGHHHTQHLNSWRCFRLARRLAFVVAQLESRGISHTVLAPPNVIVDVASGSDRVELVGLDDIYRQGLSRSRPRPQAVNGYHHPADGTGELSEQSDRFGLAILVSELLVWHSAEVRTQLYGAESFFDPDELGSKGCGRFEALHRAVAATDASLAALLIRAWQSPSCRECPSAAEWYGALQLVGLSKIAYTWFRDDTYVAFPERPETRASSARS